jgi:hypothetical protein
MNRQEAIDQIVTLLENPRFANVLADTSGTQLLLLDGLASLLITSWDDGWGDARAQILSEALTILDQHQDHLDPAEFQAITGEIRMLAGSQPRA